MEKTMRVFFLPPQFPGQEEMPCWSVWHADDVGQDESWDDFLAAVKDLEAKVWNAGENLTLAEAAILVAELEEHYPEMSFAVLPVSSSQKLS
jgi:hypothetical protein